MNAQTAWPWPIYSNLAMAYVFVCVSSYIVFVNSEDPNINYVVAQADLGFSP